MANNPTHPDPGAKDSVPQFPATSELASGHDAPYVSPEELDARAFREVEQCQSPWSWQQQRDA